jgi:uncharacterized membrane protein
MLTYYINEFVVFSFLGWVYETIFCTVRKHHWQNRGFLFGPVCPIYGTCVVLGDLLFRMISRQLGVEMASTPLWEVFLAATLGSAVIEFLTSYILEKRFHATWWDYSHLPLNIQGRISLPTSLGFGAGGTIIFRYILPVTERILKGIPEVPALLISYVFIAVMAADLALTEASLSDLLTQIQARQAQLDTEMEQRYERLEERGVRLSEAKAAAVRKLHSGIEELTSSEREWQRRPERLMSLIQRNVLQNIHHFQSEDQNSIAESLRAKLKARRNQHGRTEGK